MQDDCDDTYLTEADPRMGDLITGDSVMGDPAESDQYTALVYEAASLPGVDGGNEVGLVNESASLDFPILFKSRRLFVVFLSCFVLFYSC